MKLLLTSAGITNGTISQCLISMTGKQPAEMKVAFIPTAANVEAGNKVEWFFGQVDDLRDMGIIWIDVVDIAAPDIDWRSRLDVCDVIYVGGGNTFYLLDQVRKTGFAEYLARVLDTKVYVGVSAGSIVASPTIDVAAIPPSDPNVPGLSDLASLALVDFELEPHCNDERIRTIDAFAKEQSKTIYAIDDQTAVAIEDGAIHVVSEGTWKLCK